MKRRRNKSTKTLFKELIIIVLAYLAFQGYGYVSEKYNSSNAKEANYSSENIVSFDLSSIPEYKDEPFVYINELLMQIFVKKLCQKREKKGSLSVWLNHLVGKLQDMMT